MAWISLAAESETAQRAFETIVSRLMEAGVDQPTCIFFFATRFGGGDKVAELSNWFSDAFDGALVVGSTAAGVVGGRRELERDGALSVLVLDDPDISEAAQWIEEAMDTDDLRTQLTEFRSSIEQPKGLMLLVDPFSVDIERVLNAFDEIFEGVPIFGGLMSGAQSAGGHTLSVNRVSHQSGALAVAFTGDVTIDVIVAQGCRPIGEPYIITARRGNLIDRLDRGTPLEVLRGIVGEMEQDERKLAMTSLLVGLDMKPSPTLEGQTEDYLIRNILGIDPESGAMAIGAIPEPYQVMQFHVRDGMSADHELSRLLGTWRHVDGCSADAVLQFSCLGRGEQLFGHASHDVTSARTHLGTDQVAGFFCNGEIGPVGSRTYLHGYTTTFAIFSK